MTTHTILPLARLPRRLRNKIRLEYPGPHQQLAQDKPDETTACWIWLGHATPGGHITRNRWIHPDRETVNCSPIQFVYRREQPMVRSREYGYAVPAHRVIFAEAVGISHKAVPPMRRCPVDQCVSPHHIGFTGRKLRPAEERHRQASKDAPTPHQALMDEVARIRLAPAPETPAEAIARALAAVLPPEQLAVVLKAAGAPAPASEAKPGLVPTASPAERTRILQRLTDADVSEFMELPDAAEEAGLTLDELTPEIWAEYVAQYADASY